MSIKAIHGMAQAFDLLNVEAIKTAYALKKFMNLQYNRELKEIVQPVRVTRPIVNPPEFKQAVEARKTLEDFVPRDSVIQGKGFTVEWMSTTTNGAVKFYKRDALLKHATEGIDLNPKEKTQ